MVDGPHVDDPPRKTQRELMELVGEAQRGSLEARQALMLHWYRLAPRAAQMLAAADLSPPVLKDLSIDAVIDTTEKAVRGEIRSNPNAVYFQVLMGKIGDLREHAAVEARLAERARAGDPAALAWSSARTDDGKAPLRARIRLALRALSQPDRSLLTLVKGERRSGGRCSRDTGHEPQDAEDRLTHACSEFLKRFGDKDEEGSP